MSMSNAEFGEELDTNVLEGGRPTLVLLIKR